MAVADPALMAPVEDVESALLRRLDELKEAVSKKPSLPPWVMPLVLFLAVQTGSGIWWAATSTSDIRYLQSENAKLWQEISVLKLKNEKIENSFAEQVRSKVRETLDDLGYVRIHPQKGD